MNYKLITFSAAAFTLPGGMPIIRDIVIDITQEVPK